MPDKPKPDEKPDPAEAEFRRKLAKLLKSPPKPRTGKGQAKESGKIR